VADPGLLSGHVPSSWLDRGELSGVLAAFLAVNAGSCSDEQGGSGGSVSAKHPPFDAIVAPVFKHGEGRGAIGCVMVNAPAFLSEEEALVIIAEELAHHDIDMSSRKVVLESVVIEGKVWERRYNWISDSYELSQQTQKEPLEVDLVDPKTHVGVEYVSQDEYRRLGGSSSGYSTVQSFNLREVAGSVAGRVREDGENLYFGIFYDPVVPMDRGAVGGARQGGAEPEDWRSRLEQARERTVTESKRLLRQQVRDFADWLEGQGVI